MSDIVQSSGDFGDWRLESDLNINSATKFWRL